ncbi:energy transducer TonB [Tenacibaculum caenipelagi]|nr:energy transducer TonB [Tenacibaculum caenipelagi]
MKTPKKHARKQLEQFSNIFMQLGLVLTLLVVFLVLEYETAKEIAVLEPANTQMHEEIWTFEMPATVKKEVIQAEVPRNKRVIKDISKPKIVDNDTDVATVIDLPVKESFVDITKLTQVKEDEDIDKNDDPILINNVQSTPVFKGCEGLSEEENRKCFERKIQQHVQRNFNASLAQDVGLSSGRYKILTQFIIDKSGNVRDVKIRAPHVKLEKETDRVVHKIPQFQPGKQNNKEVKVKYILPITFKVE